MYNIFKNQSGGTAIILAMVILTAVLGATLTASKLIQGGITMNRERHYSTVSYYAAEAGAERIMWEARQGALNPGYGESGDFCAVSPASFCFDSLTDGVIDECVAPGTCANFDVQGLDNSASYTLQFEYNENASATRGTTTLTATGIYQNEKRRVQLEYRSK